MREYKEELINMTKDFSHEKNLKLAIYSAELVLPIFEEKYPKDNRPRKAIEAAKKCLESDTKENREAADAAASSAYISSHVATDFACACASSVATYAAYAVTDAAWTANATDAACAAAYYAAGTKVAGDAKTKQKILDYAIKLSEEK